MKEDSDFLTINKAEYNLENGKKGKIAIFLYNGKSNPEAILNLAVNQYLGKKKG